MSNQRPSSIAEFKHTKNRKGAKYLNINNDEFVMLAKIKKKKYS